MPERDVAVFLPLDSFDIAGRGLVVTGELKSGTLRLGMTATLGGKQTIVSGIERANGQLDVLTSGVAGLLLNGLNRSDVALYIKNGTLINFVGTGNVTASLLQPPRQPTAHTSDQARRNLRLLWGAFVAAVLIYNVVVRSLTSQPSGSVEPALLYILTGLSAIMFLAIVGIQFRLGNSLPVDVSSVFVPKLIQFTFAESIAVYGLVLTFLDGNTQRLLVFSGTSLLGLLLAYPRR